jgi:hypothetical protein
MPERLWSNKIEMERQTDWKYRLGHAVTALQKTIPRDFGMDAGFIQKKADALSGILAKYDEVNQED